MRNKKIQNNPIILNISEKFNRKQINKNNNSYS